MSKLTVDQRHAGTVSASLADTIKVTVKELNAADLQALLNHLGCELIHAVLGCEAEDVIDGTSAVWRRAVLADMLDAPIAELAMGDDINAGKDFIDTWAFVFFQTILEDVLDNKTTGLAQGNLMPHAAESLIDVLHDLRRRIAPAKLKQFLPDVASVAVDDRLRDTTE